MNSNPCYSKLDFFAPMGANTSGKVLSPVDSTHQNHRDRSNSDLPDSRFCRHDHCPDHQNTDTLPVVENRYKSGMVPKNMSARVYMDRLSNIHHYFCLTLGTGQPDIQHMERADKLGMKDRVVEECVLHKLLLLLQNRPIESPQNIPERDQPVQDLLDMAGSMGLFRVED